jgi:hypothetical protein
MGSVLRPGATSRSEKLGTALSAIARTVAESLELKAVFSRVAEAAREVLPFDIMGVSVVRDPDVPWDDLENVTFSAYAVDGEMSADEIGHYRRADVSPGCGAMSPARCSGAPTSARPSTPRSCSTAGSWRWTADP